MDVKFLGQPSTGGDQLGEAIRQLLAKPAIETLTAVAAWAKVSGLARLQPSLDAFKARGGRSEIIVGIDEGGATVEGLLLALDLFTEVWVFHDPGTRTFHPKVYVGRGASDATILVGSSNLTKGGLYTNFEASVQLDLDLSLREPDLRVLGEVDEYIASLRAFKANCLLLDKALLKKLANDPRYRIVNEGSSRSRAAAAGGETPPVPNIFGDPIRGLLGAPARELTPEQPDDSIDTDSVVEPAASPSDPTPGPTRPPSAGDAPAASAPPRHAEPSTPAVAMRFWKALSAFDVNLNSAPGQIIIPIGFRPFFEPLVVQTDKASSGGVRQSQSLFPATYIDAGRRTYLPETRAIVYEPAADHPRQNIELRFTLHNRDIAQTLRKDDILVFSKDATGAITIERRPSGSYSPGRFGWL